MLITLVIIGIIAALTIPNLLQKYQEQATVKKVQKFYSTLSNAYSLAMKENGPPSEWGLSSTWGNKPSTEKIYELLFKPYFKIAKNCGFNNTGNCISNMAYKNFNNNESANYGSMGAYYKVLLEDGAAIWLVNGSNSEFNVYYDVNGRKEPNRWGHDLFLFYLRDKLLPSGLKDFSFANNCKRGNSGQGCVAWVIYKGNMDYLHCDGLTWNSRSCKDK